MSLQRPHFSAIKQLMIKLYQYMVTIFQVSRKYYQRITILQRLLISGGIIFVVILISGVFYIKPHRKQAIAFHTTNTTIIDKHPISKMINKANTNISSTFSMEPDTKIIPSNEQQQQQLKEWLTTLQTTFQSLQQQFIVLQKTILDLTQQIHIMNTQQQQKNNQQAQWMQQLPSMQAALQQLVNQQSTIHWLKASQLTHYFQLVAVQGFSDGLRAIIDIGGHQTTLAVKESCPACRGWKLQQLDFTHQRALFEREVNKKKERVWLTVNNGESA